MQRTTQKKQYIQHKNYEECGPCPVFAGFTVTFALQLRKKHGKASVRVAIHKHTINVYHTFEVFHLSLFFCIPILSISLFLNAVPH